MMNTRQKAEALWEVAQRAGDTTGSFAALGWTVSGRHYYLASQVHMYAAAREQRMQEGGTPLYEEKLADAVAELERWERLSEMERRAACEQLAAT